jgi:hypothetical protein
MSKWLEAAKRENGANNLGAEPIEPKPVLSVVSVLSEGGRADPAPRNTAPPTPKSEPQLSAETFRHGVSLTGQPLTWTGRIVSLEAWRILNEWEKHGPNGRHWNGITKQWEQSKGKLND